MSEDVKLQQESERGSKARAILGDAMLQEAFSVAETDILEKWKASPIRDGEGQLALRLQWQCLNHIKKHLTDVLTTGKLADEMIKHNRTLREKARAALEGAVSGFKR